MNPILLIECLSLFLLLCASGIVSSAETALFSLDRTQILRLSESHQHAAQRIEWLLSDARRLLSTLLIVNTFVNVTMASIGYHLASKLMVDAAAGWAEWISILATSFVILIFGEVGPKRIAMSHPEKLAVLYGPLLVLFIKLTMPARWSVEKLTHSFNKHYKQNNPALSEDELMAVIESGEEDGILDEEERTMVDGIISLETIQASEVMTPRVDLIAIDQDASKEEQLEKVRGVRLHYLPVYKDTPDNIRGFLDVPKYLLSENHDLEAAMAQPHVVPETATLMKLLTTFQKESIHYALVVDEHGGTAGVITVGDILEEIADDVKGEDGKDSLHIEKLGKNQWLIHGSTSLEDINDYFDVELDAEGADRISGWINAHIGRVARVGDVVTTQGCRVTVRQVRRHRITTVLFSMVKAPILELDTL